MDVQRIVRTHITTEQLDPPSDLLAGVNDGSVPLLGLVKALGEYLTSTNDKVRLSGLAFLTNTVKSIATSRFNRQTTLTLARFYLAKIDDFDGLPLALQALTVLSKLPTFDDELAVEVYQTICENVNMKAHVQAVRHTVYVLFDSLLANHRQALKNMGSDFLHAYTSMVDGEKDPRNLMLLFSMDRVILLEFDIEKHAEDFFDVTFCYFPISFKPPPNDPYGITADDLKLALRECMAASPFFAKMALPLFLEKFATSAGPAMRDLLLSMAACFPIYGADACRERGTELWECLKTEITYSSDATIEAAALTALESLVRTLYPSASDVPSGLANDIIRECLQNLEEPEKSQAVASTKMIAALIRASPSAGTFAISQAFPQLFKLFNRPALPSHRTPLLTSISSILLACRSVYASPMATRSQAEEKSLERYREAIMDTLREGLRTEGLKLPATRGSVAVIEIPGFWGREEVEDVVRSINAILIEDDDAELRTAVITALTTIGKLYPDIIANVTLPLLFHNLPDSAPAISDNVQRDKYRSVLSSLAKLCDQPALFETLVIRITSKLDLLASQPVFEASEGNKDNSRASARECTVAYAFELLSCLSSVIDKKIEADHVDVVKYFDQLIPRLYQLVIAAAQGQATAGSAEPLFRDKRLLSLVGRVAQTLVWELDAQKQQKVYVALYEAFENGRFSGVVFDPSKVKASESAFRAQASSYEQDIVALYSSNIQAIKPETPFPAPSPPDWLASKVHWTIHTARSDFAVHYSLSMITSFVNKQIKVVEAGLRELLEMIWVKEVQDTSLAIDVRCRALQVYMHIIRALVLLRHSLAYEAVQRVVDILKLASFDPLFIDFAARSFSILSAPIAPTPAGKGKKPRSMLTVKLLHAQKLWSFLLPLLQTGDTEQTGRARIPYLTAFASLLPLIPASMLSAGSSFLLVLPLLLRSLALPLADQRHNAILALTSMFELESLSKETDQALQDVGKELAEGLMRCALAPDAVGTETTGKLRSGALRCLALYPNVMGAETVRSVKSDVLKSLGGALDDPLRVVRREAVECRAKWFVLK